MWLAPRHVVAAGVAASSALGISLLVLQSKLDENDANCLPSSEGALRAVGILTLCQSLLLSILLLLWTAWGQAPWRALLLVAALVLTPADVLVSLGLIAHTGADLLKSVCGGLHALLIVTLCWSILLSLVSVALGCLVIVLFILGSSRMFKHPKPDAPKDVDDFHVDQLEWRSGLLQPSSSNDGGGETIVLGLSELPGRKQNRAIRDVRLDLARASRDPSPSMCGLVSLNRDVELTFMGYSLAELHAVAEANRMHSVQFVVRDKFIPNDFEHYAKLIAACCYKLLHCADAKEPTTAGSDGFLDSSILSSAAAPASAGPSSSLSVHPLRRPRLLLHCKGGKGRTGMTAVAIQLLLAYIEMQQLGSLLIADGLSVRACIRRTRAARPGTIRNPLQIIFLYEFRSRIDEGYQMYLRMDGQSAA
jgi:hypothetical protein